MFDSRLRTLLLSAARQSGQPEPAAQDAVLLARFVRQRDTAAFDELLTRHGPAVWALCRRILNSESDAEDVFQATFLVLTRDAAHAKRRLAMPALFESDA